MNSNSIESQAVMSNEVNHFPFTNKQKSIFKLNTDFSIAQIEFTDIDNPYVNENRYTDNSGNKYSLLDIIKILNNDTSIHQNNTDNNYKDSFANNQVSNNKKLIGIPLNQVLDDIIIARNNGINMTMSGNIENVINTKKNLKKGEILLNTFDVFIGNEVIVLNDDGQIYVGNKIIDINSTFEKFINNKDKLSRKELGDVCTSLKLYELLKENSQSNIINIDEGTIKEMYDYINKGFVYQNALSNQSMLDFLYAFTKYFARINGITVQVEFFNSIKDDMGYSDNGIIGLNKNISVVNPHTLYTDTLETIFHEVFHEIQRWETEINKYTLGNAIEKLLKNNNRSYYGKNYKTILYEVDAKYNSCMILLNYLKDLAPEKYDEYYQEYMEKIENEIGNIEKNIVGNYDKNDNKYIMDDSVLSRDAALEQIIKKNPKVLEETPILKYIFNNDGTRKNLYELADIVKKHNNDKKTHIVDMINHWVRTSSYSLETIIEEYFNIYMKGTDNLPNEFKDMINNSLNQKLLGIILFETNNKKDIHMRINDILKNYETISSNEGLKLNDFIEYMENKCNDAVEKINKIKQKSKKRSIRDRLLGINYDDSTSYSTSKFNAIEDDEYVTDSEIKEELKWYKFLDNMFASPSKEQFDNIANEKVLNSDTSINNYDNTILDNEKILESKIKR